MEIALADAAVKKPEAKELKCELKDPKNECYYEVEFKVDNNKYEYKIDGVTGTILESVKPGEVDSQENPEQK